MKLLIADDEIDVREGLKYILDWSDLGFYICGEGKNGEDTLEQINKLKPDVVLMDIRMPKLSGLEVVKAARDQGFSGKFIILSGYSDFSYAQEAMKLGVSFYLTKPIDEDELEKAVTEAKNELLSEQEKRKKMVQYRDKARDSILQELLTNKEHNLFIDYQDMMLESSVYQVIIYTNYNQEAFQTTWDFASILRIANHSHDSLEYVKIENQNVILLKGDFALRRFHELVEHYISQPQKGSPLDSLFLTYGRPVYTIENIHLSYEDTQALMQRRFFCQFNQHVLGYQELPESSEPVNMDQSVLNTYPQKLADYIQSANRRMLTETLDELKDCLYHSNADLALLKHYLADIMIQVKSIVSFTYGNLNIPFPNNAAIISTVEEKYYLYEILQFFTMQFEMYMNAIGSPTRDSVMDDILQYIQHNYAKNLKLGNIAELFGYNSSYLGKVFNKTVGQSFNSYIDEVRIANSKKLLENEDYKVYEVAQMVGYANVDYFHKKFKKYANMSPAEYRKMYGKEISEE